MSERRPDELSGDSPVARHGTNAANPPVTGHPGIDSALSRVDLSGDVHEHHEQLAQALDTVRRTLNDVQQPRP